MAKRAQAKDPIDGYKPKQRADGADAQSIDGFNLDGYKNELTGFGDWTRDKTLGGKPSGVEFELHLLSGPQAEARWRGSALGARIVETVADDMVREGWEVQVQPSDEDQEALDSARRDAVASRSEYRGELYAWRRARRDFQAANPGKPFAVAAPILPPPVKMPVPEVDQDGARIAEAVMKKMEELDASNIFREALCYRRAFGGAGILVGLDDSGGPLKPYVATADRADGRKFAVRLDANDARNLTAPLDETRIKDITHLTAFRGGWDGELVAWTYYRDPTSPKYGQPEIYLLRNLGVPIARVPVPGESGSPSRVVQLVSPSDQGPHWFWVHESRLLLFPGTASSRWARVQMRGWGDSIFTRVDEVLSAFSQTWSGVANLMQDFAQGVLGIEGLAQRLAAKNDGSGNRLIAKRAVAMNMGRSIAKLILIDSTEKFDRVTTPLTGIADILQQFALLLAAAAGLPVTRLMGQAPAGLNATGDADVRFYYDHTASEQERELGPMARRLARLILLSKSGPTEGVEPEKWSLSFSPLYQMTAMEQATLRKTVAETDHIYITDQVLEPAEVTASAFGGSEWTADRTIDLEGRAAMAEMEGERTVTMQKQQESSAMKSVTPKDADDQPRVPGGSPDGGEFAGKGGGSIAAPPSSGIKGKLESGAQFGEDDHFKLGNAHGLKPNMRNFPGTFNGSDKSWSVNGTELHEIHEAVKESRAAHNSNDRKLAGAWESVTIKRD